MSDSESVDDSEPLPPRKAYKTVHRAEWDADIDLPPLSPGARASVAAWLTLPPAGHASSSDPPALPRKAQKTSHSPSASSEHNPDLFHVHDQIRTIKGGLVQLLQLGPALDRIASADASVMTRQQADDIVEIGRDIGRALAVAGAAYGQFAPIVTIAERVQSDRAHLTMAETALRIDDIVISILQWLDKHSLANVMLVSRRYCMLARSIVTSIHLGGGGDIPLYTRHPQTGRPVRDNAIRWFHTCYMLSGNPKHAVFRQLRHITLVPFVSGGGKLVTVYSLRCFWQFIKRQLLPEHAANKITLALNTVGHSTAPEHVIDAAHKESVPFERLAGFSVSAHMYDVRSFVSKLLRTVSAGMECQLKLELTGCRKLVDFMRSLEVWRKDSKNAARAKALPTLELTVCCDVGTGGDVVVRENRTVVFALGKGAGTHPDWPSVVVVSDDCEKDE